MVLVWYAAMVTGRRNLAQCYFHENCSSNPFIPKSEVNWWREQFFNHGLQDFQDFEKGFSMHGFDAV
jgi:hypothetical protein